MSPMSMKRSPALFALVVLVSISRGSAFMGLRGKPSDRAFEPLPDEDDLTPEELMQDLSKGYQLRWAEVYKKKVGPAHEISGLVYTWMSRTGNKKKPKTIFNKYSIQDLLDLNLVYDKKATLQEYDRRKQMCEDLSPGEIDEKKWRIESRFRQSDEAKLLNQKYFLSQYCWKTFRIFRFGSMENLDKQVRRKLSKEDNETLDMFFKSLMKHSLDPPSKGLASDAVIEDHVKSYDKEELAKLKASCLKLDQLAETYRLEEFSTSSSGEMWGYCKVVKTV